MGAGLRSGVACAAVLVTTAGAFAQSANFDLEAEGFHGPSFASGGITFFNSNNVAGHYPDGQPFTADSLGNELIVEDSTFAVVDFPEFLSGPNALTFGNSYIPGPNLSLGALATVSMSVGHLVTGATFDILYYENGPWGGIEVRLEALNNGQVVASNSFVVPGSDGRDNPAGRHMAIGGVDFDTVRLSSHLNGDYTTLRAIVDNVQLVPAPGSIGVLALVGWAARRRR